MKEIIKNVLSQYKDAQINLGSDSAVENISAEIETAILKHFDPFNQNDFSPDEGNHRWPGLDAIIKENGGLPGSEWVCGICGEDTSRVEYDYIGTGYNHLKCELEHEEEQ